MAAIRLKGLNKVTKKLASGATVTYWYAWKGGPRLEGKPGSPEFIASFSDAAKKRGAVVDHNTLGYLFDLYEEADYYKHKVHNSTKQQKERLARNIRKEFGDLPRSVLTHPETVELLEEWRAEIAERSPSEADHHWIELNARLNWAVKKRLLDFNPYTGYSRLANSTRIDKIWSEAEEAQFLERAPTRFHLPLLLAIWTGQREAALVALRWSAYDGQYIRFVQTKVRRGQKPKHFLIPVAGPLKRYLDKEEKLRGIPPSERDEHYILLTEWGTPWAHSKSFSTSFGNATRSAGIVDRTFHDLRGTAVTRFARAGCTVPEIATITQHSLKTVEQILDHYYLHRDTVMADNALRKRIQYELPNWTPNQRLRPKIITGRTAA